MENKILTAEEIITAVECCISNTQDCSACVFLGTGIKEKTTCEVKMMKNALDLIKRQQAKEKELQEKLVIYRGMIDHQKAEIKRLKEDNEKHGEWICFASDGVGKAFNCSLCGYVETTDDFDSSPLDNDCHYCSRCGAKMDGAPTP